MPDIKSSRMMVETAKTIAILKEKKDELVKVGRLEDAEILKKEIARKLDEYQRFSDINSVFSKSNS